MATTFRAAYDRLHQLPKDDSLTTRADAVRLVTLGAEIARAARAGGIEIIEQRAEAFRRATRKGGRVYQLFLDVRRDLLDRMDFPSILHMVVALLPAEARKIFSNLTRIVEVAAWNKLMGKPVTTTVQSDRKGGCLESEDGIYAIRFFLRLALLEADSKSSALAPCREGLLRLVECLGVVSVLTPCNPCEMWWRLSDLQEAIRSLMPSGTDLKDPRWSQITIHDTPRGVVARLQEEELYCSRRHLFGYYFLDEAYRERYPLDTGDSEVRGASDHFLPVLRSPTVTWEPTLGLGALVAYVQEAAHELLRVYP